MGILHPAITPRPRAFFGAWRVPGPCAHSTLLVRPRRRRSLLAEAPVTAQGPQRNVFPQPMDRRAPATAHSTAACSAKRRASRSPSPRRNARRRRGTGRRPMPPPNVRVSYDILEPDASRRRTTRRPKPKCRSPRPGQRGLVAGYQEDRFEDAVRAHLQPSAATAEGIGAKACCPTSRASPAEVSSAPATLWVAFEPARACTTPPSPLNETNPDNEVTLSTSEDGGQSWGAPVVVHVEPPTRLRRQESVVADLAPDSRTRVASTSLWDTVLYDNRQILRIASSQDSGASFSARSTSGATGSTSTRCPWSAPTAWCTSSG